MRLSRSRSTRPARPRLLRRVSASPLRQLHSCMGSQQLRGGGAERSSRSGYEDARRRLGWMDSCGRTRCVSCRNGGRPSSAVSLRSLSGPCSACGVACGPHAPFWLLAGKRRYDRKQAGFGGQTKPVFHKKVRPPHTPRHRSCCCSCSWLVAWRLPAACARLCLVAAADTTAVAVAAAAPPSRRCRISAGPEPCVPPTRR